jgi:hypothetical protein
MTRWREAGNTPSPSLRAKRSNPSCGRKERMDCFVARAPRKDEETADATHSLPATKSHRRSGRGKLPPGHCERSEAIHRAAGKKAIHLAPQERKNGLLRRCAPRNDAERAGLHSTFAGSGCSEAAFAIRAALAIPASAATFFCGSEPGCTTPADMIRVAASSALMSTSMILLLGT